MRHIHVTLLCYNLKNETVCVFHFKLRSVADKFGLAVHMDGARVMNAAVALGVQPSVILQHCHSVSVCLSKVSTHFLLGSTL